MRRGAGAGVRAVTFPIVRRRLFTFFSFVSLLALAALAVLWVRGYWVSDSLTWTSREATFCAARFGGGRLELMRSTSDPSAFVETGDSVVFEKPKPGFEYDRGSPADADTWGFGSPETDVRLLGVRYRYGPVLFLTARHLSMPVAYPLVLAAVLPALWLRDARRRRLRRRRAAAGCCVACGYDLRGSSGRCPECGREVERDSA
jgi:hypothetical protein